MYELLQGCVRIKAFNEVGDEKKADNEQLFFCLHMDVYNHQNALARLTDIIPSFP